MLRTACLAALLATTASIAPAVAQGAPEAVHDPLITWQGGATFITVPAACDNGARGISVGDVVTSIYRPQLDPAEPRSALTLIGSRFAHSFFKTTAGQMHGTGSFTGGWMSGRATTVAGGGGVTGTYNFTTSPAAVAENTPFVTITGRIVKFAGITGCNIQFKGSYVRRPN